MYILGINTNHNATATLLLDGRVIACVSEERFSRKKNQSGIPKNAIKSCLNVAKIKPKQLGYVAVADLISAPLIENLHTPPKVTPPTFLTQIEYSLETKIPILRQLIYAAMNRNSAIRQQTSQVERLIELRKILPLPEEKFVFIDHHTCHANTALYSSGFLNFALLETGTGKNKFLAGLTDQAESLERATPSSHSTSFDRLRPRKISVAASGTTLVFTADGAGDGKSATIWEYKNDQLKLIQEIDSQQSLGFFYLHITEYLGMKPIEDEHKVMGLAPYATHQIKINAVYKKLMQFFTFDETNSRWVIKINEHLIQQQLPRLLARDRFDHIAAAAQRITEELILKWVQTNVSKHQAKYACFGGGVFANVKLNHKIAQLPQLKQAFFTPSPGDESNALGAAFVVTRQVTSPTNLYLGPSFNSRNIQTSVKKYSNLKIKKPKNINRTVAQLLARGEVVARFAGRMEFGARALGNRSILANPSRTSVINIINESIKSRDFWMPFAPTILRERVKDYLILHHADSPFMSVAYDTTTKGKTDLAAAIHPYDKTTRPQILDQTTNPSYYELIKQFEKLTGIGAVLNTSFNLHGEPIVMTPADALRVFNLSGLKYLILENYLISKSVN